MAGALAGARLADAEQPAHPAIGHLVGWIDEKCRAIGKIEARAGQRANAGNLLGVPRAHDPGDAVPVGDAERGQSEHGSGGEELLGRRGPAQEAEMRRDLQLDIGRSFIGHAAPLFGGRTLKRMRFDACCLLKRMRFDAGRILKRTLRE